MTAQIKMRWGFSVGFVSLVLFIAPAAHAGWLAPVDISDAGGNVGSPQVVLDSSGNATAVWGNGAAIESAYRPAGEGWQAPSVISGVPGEGGEASSDGNYPRIAVDSQGDTTAVWESYGGTNRLLIRAAYRRAGGNWQTPLEVGEVHTMMDPEPWVAVDAQGNATVTWTAGGTIFSTYKPVDESWQTPVALSSAEAYVPQAAVDTQGDATVVWMHHTGSHYIVQSAYRPAGGAWEAPIDLSEPGEEGGDPQIALDSHGDTMVVWNGHPTEYTDVVRVAYRAAGGGWQAPVSISMEGEMIESLHVALDAQGDALVAWAGYTKEVGGYSTARAAYRPAGGSWESPKQLSQDGNNAFPADLVFDAKGNAAILWQRYNGSHNILQADYRPAGGEWKVATDVSREGSNAMDAVLVLDAPGDAAAADGDATAVWVSGNDGACEHELRCVGSYVVQAAGYDTHDAPSEGLEVPETGTVGTPVEVSVPAEDTWSPRLEFGDGSTSSTGTSTTHTYSSPGEYTVTFASTEVLGYRTTARRTITIVPDEAGSGAGGNGLGAEEGVPGPEEGGSVSGEKSAGSEAGSPPPTGGTPGDSKQPVEPSAVGASGSSGNVHTGFLQSGALGLRLTWKRQTRRMVLARRSIRIVCAMSVPGTCVAHGSLGAGRTKVTASGGKTLVIGLTRHALSAIRRGQISRLTFTVMASSQHRTATRLLTLELR